MKTKEEYYKLVKKNRRIANDSKHTKCPCPNTECEWHGKCKECIAIHRYHKDHLPNCLKPMITERLRGVASIGEMDIVEKEKTPLEYRRYVKETDKKLNKENN